MSDEVTMGIGSITEAEVSTLMYASSIKEVYDGRDM
jgi:hypothetical protein